MRVVRPLVAALVLGLACAGCTGGNFIDLPLFPDSSCASCAPSFFASDSRRL